MEKVAQCDVIKMKEMRGEVEKKPPKKIWIITHFYDVICLFFSDFFHLHVTPTFICKFPMSICYAAHTVRPYV